MNSVRLLLSLIVLLMSYTSHGQVNDDQLKKPWSAKWIKVPGTSGSEYGVYHFRKIINLQNSPERFIVHISADNRYKLYVNGQLVSLGPARGDRYYWNYETVDLIEWLHPGNNILAAVVWNEAEYRPEAQISLQTAFILQGAGDTEQMVNTDSSWKCIKNNAYSPLTGIGYNTYYVAGPGEMIDMHNYPDYWFDVDFEDKNWPYAVNVSGWRAEGHPKGVTDASDWMLIPSAIPAMELKNQRLAALREVVGVTAPEQFPLYPEPIQIPPHTKARLLLDQSYLTNAYMHLLFSKGDDASIGLSYAEALFEKNGEKVMRKKGNRNEIKNKILLGRRDSLISNGRDHQHYTSLSWRTFRYIQIGIETKAEPLIIEDLYGTFTGYPFEMKARLDVGDENVDQILEIGWRTARLCAVETYMDCPYYEQLQYIGDTRIQALVSLYNSGDDRLVRNALNQMDHSRLAEGVTLSRHPSYTPQIISTFSLWYIGMLHDYWMYGNDEGFVKEKLDGIRQILSFFNRFQQSDGSLRNLPYWVFTDWISDDMGWDFGQPPVGEDGSSSILDLQLLWAYQLAAEMEEQLGMEEYVNIYKLKSAQLKSTILTAYWDDSKGLFADNGDKKDFSQHANSLALLTHVVTKDLKKLTGQKLLEDQSLTPATIYFKYYLHRALVEAGFGNDYMRWLDIWKENIALGLTTWAEKSDVSGSRSDCHAWGSSPNIEFYRTVLGIDSGAPGFKIIHIKPHLGILTNASGKIPHPAGEVRVKYAMKGQKWSISINLPPETSGYLFWKGEDIKLKSGENKFVR